MYGSNYVWILSGTVVRADFGGHGMVDLTDTGCTMDQIKDASNGYFSLHYDQLDAQNSVTINNMVSPSWCNFLYGSLP